jgi:hypothetical protein
MAEEINAIHAEVQGLADKCLRAGVKTVERAIACGTYLRAVKAALKHGEFENWCAQHVKFKMRQTQYYMVLAEHHATKDIMKMKPQSLRQALIYAGALPEDPVKKRGSANFDQLGRVRKTLNVLLRKLKASQDYHADELLVETEAIVEWRNQLAARLGRNEMPANVVDITAEVKPEPGPKTQHDAFLATARKAADPAANGLDHQVQTPCKANDSTKARPEGPVRDQVVGFRLTAQEHSALQDCFRANRVVGARSASDLARIVVIDFIEGRLHRKDNGQSPNPKVRPARTTD